MVRTHEWDTALCAPGHAATRAEKYVGQRVETEGKWGAARAAVANAAPLATGALSPQIGRLLPIFGCF